MPDCAEAKTCRIAGSCPYATVFEPRQEWVAAGPSGLADWPRPFVFRALHLDGRSVQSQETFHFDLVLFEEPAKVLPYFILTFRELAATGLGPSRGRAVLASVHELGGREVYDGQRFRDHRPAGLTFNLEAPEQADRVTVIFETATELKSGGELVSVPGFAVLLRRLRDRISNLRSCYQGGPLDIDFEDLGRQAEQVEIVRSELRRVDWERRSSRTGQTHPLGGFAGEIEYRGDLSRFAPFLKAGEWTGVGRQTVWGKGQIRVAL